MAESVNYRAIKNLEYEKIIKAIIDNCGSEPGKEKAAHITISTDIEEINNRLDALNEAILFIFSHGSTSIEFKDLKGTLKKAELGSVLNNKELLDIAQLLSLTGQVKSYLKNINDEEKFPILDMYYKNLTDMRGLKEKIESIVISEEEIADNASTLLKSLRRQKSNINEKIRSALNSIIMTHQKELQDPIITIRQGRYVVPVKQEYRSAFKGLVHDQSSSGATLFIEPMQVVELNNELKQVELKEQQEIQRILAELSGYVKNDVAIIYKNIEILTELDLVFAKAKYSININGTRPELNTKGYIKLKNARHPLINPKVVVPINIYLGKEFDTLVITGPNTGGKTVTLKTVGLLTLMAMSGLNIPADEGSQVAVFNNVFVDIGDEQSIEQSLSTFSAHITNIVDILNNVDNNCLVLLDELGAGTDPTEGAALAMSILDMLHKIGAKTLATTHYSELKQYALKTPGVENASVEFDVETLRPTYKVSIGVPGKSNAFEISKRLGLPNEIILNAKNYISDEALRFEDIINDLESKRSETEKANREIMELKHNIQTLKDELENEREKLRQEKEKILENAKEKAKKILDKARITANEVIEKIKEAEKSERKNKLIEEARSKLKENIEELENGLKKPKGISYGKVPEDIMIGQSIYIVPLDQNGIALSQPDKSGNVEVQAGILKLNVHISNLRVIENTLDEEVKMGYSKFVNEKPVNVSPSIDLRGKNLDDAAMEVEKYIDDAYLAGLKQVTIIHGRGTGILRAGISQLLSKNKHIKSYRLGRYGEGGDGVTIAELKEK